MGIIEELKKELPETKENVSLKEYTTFKIGGCARYFFEARENGDLIKAVGQAKRIGLPFFVLGGGSNLLVADEGFSGLVIKMRIDKCEARESGITAGAGLPLAKLVDISLKNGFTGLEWMAGIPGTLGGAVYGNAGALGLSMKDIVKEVEVFDIEKQEIRTFKNEDCGFGYRRSVFKEKPNFIIISAFLNLKKGAEAEIRERIKESLNHRNETQPKGFSAGSVFKNPEGFHAGELIEKCGLKGKTIGGVKISEKHANFMINMGRGRAKDAVSLINEAKREVKNRFGVALEEEIRYLGF